VLIGKAAKTEGPPPDADSIQEAVAALVREGLPRMDAIKAVARRHGLSKHEVYEQVNVIRKS